MRSGLRSKGCKNKGMKKNRRSKSHRWERHKDSLANPPREGHCRPTAPDESSYTDISEALVFTSKWTGKVNDC